MKRLLIAAAVAALVFVGVAHAGGARPPLPPLPDSIPSQLGWVMVHRVPHLKCNNLDALGCFDAETRELSVRDSIHPATAWQTLEHERVHMILFDAGIEIRTPGLEDHLADAIGAARVTERLAQ